jgi:hypothetical protein
MLVALQAKAAQEMLLKVSIIPKVYGCYQHCRTYLLNPVKENFLRAENEVRRICLTY